MKLIGKDSGERVSLFDDKFTCFDYPFDKGNE